MRVLVKAVVPVGPGNEAFRSGKLQQILGTFMEKNRPEATYFLQEDGCRTGMFVLDLADASAIPALVEPLFQGLEAHVTIHPVMTPEDLMKGTAQLRNNS